MGEPESVATASEEHILYTLNEPPIAMSVEDLAAAEELPFDIPRD